MSTTFAKEIDIAVTQGKKENAAQRATQKAQIKQRIEAVKQELLGVQQQKIATVSLKFNDLDLGQVAEAMAQKKSNIIHVDLGDNVFSLIDECKLGTRARSNITYLMNADSYYPHTPFYKVEIMGEKIKLKREKFIGFYNALQKTAAFRNLKREAAAQGLHIAVQVLAPENGRIVWSCPTRDTDFKYNGTKTKIVVSVSTRPIRDLNKLHGFTNHDFDGQPSVPLNKVHNKQRAPQLKVA